MSSIDETKAIHPAQHRGADGVGHPHAGRRQVRHDAGRAARPRPATGWRRARSSPTTSRRSAPSSSDWIADPGIDAIITTGGTGFTGRDVTPEAIEPLFEKRMDGFSIAFHMLSYAKIGTSTIQTRATAGVAGATYIFCLPGSPGACRDGWDGILAAQLDYRTALQFRRDHAAARRASAPRQGQGRRLPSSFGAATRATSAAHSATGFSAQAPRIGLVIVHEFGRDAARAIVPRPAHSSRSQSPTPRSRRSGPGQNCDAVRCRPG